MKCLTIKIQRIIFIDKCDILNDIIDKIDECSTDRLRNSS